jgi:hypothetical protein
VLARRSVVLARGSVALAVGLALAVGSVLALPGGNMTAEAAAAPPVRAVFYAGYRFEIPASWQVINLAEQPRTCVRFDLHAIYLGTPAANESCPGWLLGTTEAMLIQPASRDMPRRSAENPVSNQITASAPGVMVTATFDTDPAEIDQILASAGLSAPRLTAEVPPARGASDHELAVAAAPVRNATAASVASSELPASVANDVGLGFDTCSAPSSGVMQAWLQQSPYRAVGIYIGGADRACDQSNLTAAWVQQQAAAGWRFIPMYAGPQAALGQLTSPTQQGTADADDAVAQAQQLGFGPSTPLYYDMESYQPGESGAVIAFLAAWVLQLHTLGYDAGVYGGSDSGIADLSQSYQSGSTATPDVIFDALWNGEANTSDSHYLPGEWTGGRRVHQFSGNASQTFGGDNMVIDQDYLDVTLPASPPSPPPTPTPAPTPTPSPTPTPHALSGAGTPEASPAIVTPTGTTEVFYTTSGHHLIEQSSGASGAWTRTDLGVGATGLPSVVQAGSGTIDVFYRDTGGFLAELTSAAAGWLPAQQLTHLGQVSVPEAISQPDGVIDVFWAGLKGVHVWHARYAPATGWTAPQSLGGFVSGSPDPVQQPSGAVQVFWRGLVYGNLWRVVLGTTGAAGRPQDLGMGVLGAPPQAVALPSGEVDVFWRGLGLRRIWSSVLLSGAGPARPVVDGGTTGVGQPWPVLAAGGEWLLFQGPYRGLLTVTRAVDGQWPGMRWAGLSGLASPPYAAVGPESGALEVFWLSKTSQLWTARFTAATGWSKADELGQ